MWSTEMLSHHTEGEKKVKTEGWAKNRKVIGE